jgi:hypothetical protein
MPTTPRDTPDARPLPNPGDVELRELFGAGEVYEAARFLLERREDPPTMVEWLGHAAIQSGRTSAHAGRRLRDVRKVFEVRLESRKGGDPVYRLVGWAPVRAANAVSGALQAEVFQVRGRYCAMCGRVPADGVRLQIDHKVPASWGGATELENLEPLCTEHNHGKQAFFASLNPYAHVLKAALGLPTPWERIGAALIAVGEAGEMLPSRLLPVIGGETHEGDPARRLRDLRVVLGWDVRAHKAKVGKRTVTSYELVESKPWPPEGPAEAVRAYEARRKSAKRVRDES